MNTTIGNIVIYTPIDNRISRICVSPIAELRIAPAKEAFKVLALQPRLDVSSSVCAEMIFLKLLTILLF